MSRAIKDIEMTNETAYAAVVGGGKTLSFESIEYTVNTKDDEGKAYDKDIVRTVSGQVKGGNMLCILGPSGSGKTSLVHIISGRIQSTKNKSHQVNGNVLVDGSVISSTKFRRMSGLVTQEDIFEPSLTVEETLMFAAALKLKTDEVSQKARVDEIIKSLQLDSCRQTCIGDDANPYLKGISGGEKRRVAIAMEILDPTISLLMLDEPTSGLDAAAAQMVVNLLRKLANSGMAVLTTLHQPRNSIMDQFDSVMVLAKGRTIYYGDKDGYIPYLEKTLQCKVGIHESPYDVLLDELNPAIGEGEAPKVGAIPAGFDGSVGDKLADIFVQTNPDYNQRKTVITLGGVIEEEPKMDWMTFCHVTWVLLQRIFIVKMRDPIAAMTQVSSAIIMGLIYGGLYSNVYDKSTISFSILDTQMCIVMVVMMCVWLPYDVCLTFPLERKIFLRERKAGLYPTLAFYLARITADVPAHIFSAFIMSVIVWGLAGLKIGLGNFILIMIFGILIGASMMQTIGAISRTFEEANIYMMVILMMSMMLGTGFVREVPSWLGWARSISVMGLTADLAMYLEFKDVDPKYGTAAEIFAQYGVRITNDTQMWEGVLTLLQILIVCRILCFIAVKFMFTGRTFEEDLAD